MTINKFIEAYKQKTLLGDPISVGTTALRYYIKDHRSELEKDNIVKFTKKLSSLSIEIVDPEGLYRKIS